MSTFGTRIVEIDSVAPHPDADAIEIVMVGRYRSIVRKDAGLKAGSRVAYVQEASLLPEYLLKRLGLWNEELGQGKLGGPGYNRVSPMRLRGVFSQGICMPALSDADDPALVWVEGESERFSARLGDDLADALGICKWVPIVPPELLGDVFPAEQRLTVDFDVEDVKAYPDVIAVGEEVEFREKLHGVFTGVSVVPVVDAIPEAFGSRKNVLLYSKGLGAQGMAFADTEENRTSIYVRSTETLRRRIEELAFDLDEPLTVMGETFGPGVQDLHYGGALQFRIFAACSGYRGDHRYFNADDLATLAKDLGVELVPVLYRGPFSWEALEEHTNGVTALGGKHVREGVVVTPVVERKDLRLGRVALKSVSEKYLLRKGGTEYS
jgi:RNA ligase (TIGR02306 family)